MEKAFALRDVDINAAIDAYHEMAEQGSTWAMRSIAWRHETGSGVPVDLELAESWYRRSVLSGSWLATLDFARLEVLRGEFDDGEWWLKSGVDLGWTPAFFWLAWYRIKRSKKRRLDPEIRQLLEHAETHGHPMAKEIHAWWMARGRFGLRLIPLGFRDGWREVVKTGDDWEAYKSQASDPGP